METIRRGSGGRLASHKETIDSPNWAKKRGKVRKDGSEIASLGRIIWRRITKKGEKETSLAVPY